MNNPILIGFMGAGKTTVGQALAESLALPFCDLDQEIEAHLGQSIPSYFRENGEAAFRRVEKERLAHHLSTENILSTGGGTACQEANREVLASQERPVVWLQASDETTIQNLSGENWAKRPILSDKTPADVAALKASRSPSYEAAADLVILVDNKTPEAIAAEIIEAIDNRY